MDFFKKYFVSIILLLVVIVAAFYSGVYFSARHSSFAGVPNIIQNASEGEPDSVDFSPFWKVWNTIDEKYVNTTSTSTNAKKTDQDRVWGSIQGLVASLGDPYTVFFPPRESQQFQEEVSGNFTGIGIEIGFKDSTLTVVSPLKNTPAYKAGLLAGDLILGIGTTSTSGLNIDEAVKLIRGPAGTAVDLMIGRSGTKEPFRVKVLRDNITIPTIDTELLPSGVYVIRLYNFSAVAPDLFRQALRDFLSARTDKLILDLRGNPGGYLDAAIDMSSWFLPAGAVIVTEDYNKDTPQTVFRSKGYDIFNENLKFAILVDSGSASASEILAGALREHGVATLVGDKTYGKGSVQELIPVTPNTSLKVTIAKWLTPNGVSISEKGIVPDIIATSTPDQVGKAGDKAQEAAVRYLLNKK